MLALIRIATVWARRSFEQDEPRDRPDDERLLGKIIGLVRKQRDVPLVTATGNTKALLRESSMREFELFQAVHDTLTAAKAAGDDEHRIAARLRLAFRHAGAPMLVGRRHEVCRQPDDGAPTHGAGRACAPDVRVARVPEREGNRGEHRARTRSRLPTRNYPSQADRVFPRLPPGARGEPPWDRGGRGVGEQRRHPDGDAAEMGPAQLTRAGAEAPSERPQCTPDTGARSSRTRASASCPTSTSPKTRTLSRLSVSASVERADVRSRLEQAAQRLLSQAETAVTSPSRRSPTTSAWSSAR